MPPNSEPSVTVLTVPEVASGNGPCRLVAWLKTDGAVVQPGEFVAVIENDKASMDLEATSLGVLRVKVAAGQEVSAGDEVCTLTLQKFISEQFVCELEGARDSSSYATLLEQQMDARPVHLSPWTKGRQFSEALAAIYAKFDRWGYEVVNVLPLQTGFRKGMGIDEDGLEESPWLAFTVTTGAVVVGKHREGGQRGTGAAVPGEPAPYDPLAFDQSQVDYLM